jgi:glycosyltransferase involved in cell wall biosynthesis
VPAKILINGDFLCRRLTGIERYAHDITMGLDKISQPKEITLIIPQNTENVPSYQNIEVIRHKKNIKSHLWWQMITLQWFLVTHKEYLILEYGNTCLPFAPGIVFLHDIYCELFPEDFRGFRDRLIRMYNKLQYRLIAKKAKKIITVSYFSRNQIADTYHINSESISVIYNSWEHFKSIEPDYGVFNEFPMLKEKNYYFSLGSLSKRKNLKWIMEYAKKHPEDIFAISGTSLPTVKVDELENSALLSNIILLGYLNDAKIKALMQKCKAFLQPSYYEGFGIPPLEALSAGSPIIISNAASLPEIYGNTARYIDPYNTDIDLDKLLLQPVEAPENILNEYSCERNSARLYNIIKEFEGTI